MQRKYNHLHLAGHHRRPLRRGRIEGEALKWITPLYPFPTAFLSPSVETRFKRITLVDKALTERVTIDFEAGFRNLRNSREAGIGEAVIIELKQDSRLRSALQDILLRRRVKPLRVSKYCIGVVSTDPSVHPGRFKEKIRTIVKVGRLSPSEPLTGNMELPSQMGENR